MTTSEYFEQQAQRCQRDLEAFDAMNLQVFEPTDKGERDVSDQHRRDLVTPRDEYYRVADLWRK